MSEPFIGEIRIVGFSFAPRGWMQCNGQLLAIQQYAALFSLLGTTYGGNGQTNFQLPNFQSRIPIHQGTGNGLSTYVMGQQSGTENVTLFPSQIPTHTHIAACNTGAGNSSSPTNNFWAANANTGLPQYCAVAPNASMAPAAGGTAGGNIPHPNIMPVLCLNFVIATVGIYPARN